MDTKDFVSAIASVDKLIIENLNLLRDEKEYWKSTVDVMADTLKLISPQTNPQFSVLGYDWNTILQIKKVAAQYLVDKVVVFPVFYECGNYQIFIKVYGQDKEKIFEVLNAVPLHNSSVNNVSYIEICEKNYGIIIYEREC